MKKSKSLAYTQKQMGQWPKKTFTSVQFSKGGAQMTREYRKPLSIFILLGKHKSDLQYGSSSPWAQWLCLGTARAAEAVGGGNSSMLLVEKWVNLGRREISLESPRKHKNNHIRYSSPTYIPVSTLLRKLVGVPQRHPHTRVCYSAVHKSKGKEMAMVPISND